MKHFLYIIILGASLIACSSSKKVFVNGQEIFLNQEISINAIDSIVQPYKVELEEEMNKIICTAEVNFINERPSGNLGNIVTDLLLNEYKLNSELKHICVLNWGGLRANLNKGELSVGDIFKVMPFDNTIFVTKLSGAAMYEISSYLKNSGGEPISGFTIVRDKVYDSEGNEWDFTKDFYVITSDFLYNGGDNMDFFQKHALLEPIQTGELMRDKLLKGFGKMKILKDNQEQRIILK